jgi:GNAT superfamily N-acetyltransferase
MGTIKKDIKDGIVYHLLPEWEMLQHHEADIIGLFSICFPGYPAGKTFIKQMPSIRILGYHDGHGLIAHTSLDLRIVNNDGNVRKVIAIGDFCIHPNYQGKGFGGNLMQKIKLFGKEINFDFLLAISGEHGFYLKNSFTLKDTVCRWMIILNEKSIGLAQRELKNSLYVYHLKNDITWINGNTDLLGSVF